MTKLNKEQLEELQEIFTEAIAKRLNAMNKEEASEAEKDDEEVVEEELYDEEAVEDKEAAEEEEACCEKNDDGLNQTLAQLLNSESFKELAKVCKNEPKRSSLDKLADSVKDGAECFGELGEYVDGKIGKEFLPNPAPRVPVAPAISFEFLGKVLGGSLGLGFGLLGVLRDEFEDLN